MVRCKECSAMVAEGTLFCGECGAFMLERNAEAKPAGGQTRIVPPPPGERSLTPPAIESAPFSEDADMTPPPSLVGQNMNHSVAAQKATFVIPTSGRRHSVTIQDEIRIGRADPASHYYPELDLTPDNGAQRGVSRRHATIQRSNRGILLVDLNSTNGTSLNNFRIPPDLPYPIKNGDEIRFGQLLVHVFLS